MNRLLLCFPVVALSILSVHFSVRSQNSSPLQRLQNSPLAAYPGFGHNPKADETTFNQQEIARERIISNCMKQKGFPYTSTTPIRIKDDATSRQYGTSKENPNVRYAQSLSQQQRQGYHMALYGVVDPNALSIDELFDSSKPGGGGCQGEAFSAFTSVFAAQSVLNEQYIDLRQSIQVDSRVQAAEKRWSECMRGRGYQFSTTLDLNTRFDNDHQKSKLTPELEQYYDQASKIGQICGTKVSLENTIAQVRIEKDAVFVAKYKTFLDQHVRKLRSEEALMKQILNQPN